MTTRATAEVDDIASVASGVAVVEVNHGAEQILMALAGDDATSTDELGNDGEDHQRRENGGHDRVEVRRISQGRTPSTIIMTPTATEPMAGSRKFRFRLSTEVLRQASSGPTAVSSMSNNATGTATRLKKGGPTVTLCP